MKTWEGMLDGSGLRFGLVVARFNDLVTEPLLKGAVDCLVRHGVNQDDLHLVRVPGAWELSGACARLADSGLVDGIVALGCVIRGATPHFDLVAGEAAAGIGALNRTGRLPVSFGVLTTDSLEQALERSGSKAGNKGWEAAAAALEMAHLYRELP
ncbi:MAG: 6,7-dimethyl-8-ribityllumazine synthase [Gemmatimonadales bacterium]|nr:MAG: 6,7-dimethyl-8-ribityllumazine synthase [Gemmatimonadales bacterium]